MRPIFLLVVAVALGGCDDPPSSSADVPLVGDEPGPVAGEGEGEIDGADVGWPAAPPALRRLSHSEYNNSLFDLAVEAGQTLPPQLFAEDPTVDGFQNRAKALGPSPILVEQRRAAASQIAARLAPQALPQMWAGPMLRRLFRGPIPADDEQAFAEFLAAATEATDESVAGRAMLVAALQSPRFLYRADDNGPHAVASRLSYLLWGSLPDEALLAAADAGELGTEAEVTAQVERLLADDRSMRRILEFHAQWLDLDSIKGVNKDPRTFPAYDELLKASMRSEADRLIELHVAAGGGHAQLLRDSTGIVDRRLAELYGAEVPEEGPQWWAPQHHPAERAGLLTQGWFLASRAHLVHPSPVLRGVFVLDRVLCRTPPPPDPGIDASPPTGDEADAPITNRQRYAAHVVDTICRACHEAIDGIGYAFESYDAIGANRLTDAGEPVDSSGWVILDDERVEVASAVDLAKRLADSDEVDRCVARQWFRFGFGRDLQSADEAWFKTFVTRWQADGRGTHTLLRSLAMALAMAR